MRETALLIARTAPIAALVTLVVLGSVACGDDDTEDPKADAGSIGGRGGRGGLGGGGGGGSRAEPIEPLPSKTAGKACEGDADCGPGRCLSALPGAFGAAGTPTPGGYCSGDCATSSDCGEGGTCSGAFAGLGGIGAMRGRCLKTCATSTDCREGYRCVNAVGQPVSGAGATVGALGPNTCQPSPETDKLADGLVGSACSADGDCGDGRCLRTSNGTTFPGGYCTGRCLEDSECGASGTCTPGLAGGAGTCYLSCSNDGDCSRAGYRCRASGADMQCVPGAAPLPDDVVGRACSGDGDCGAAAMSCGTRLGLYEAPGGYCTQRCVNASDCGAGGVCVGGRGGTTASGTCYRACANGGDCRDGYTCGPAGRTGTAAMQNICSVTPPPDDAGVP